MYQRIAICASSESALTVFSDARPDGRTSYGNCMADADQLLCGISRSWSSCGRPATHSVCVCVCVSSDGGRRFVSCFTCARCTPLALQPASAHLSWIVRIQHNDNHMTLTDHWSALYFIIALFSALSHDRCRSNHLSISFSMLKSWLISLIILLITIHYLAYFGSAWNCLENNVRDTNSEHTFYRAFDF